MSKWIECKLSDLGTIVSGATPSTTNPDFYGGNIAWITPKDLSNFNGRYIKHGERNITELGMKSCSTKLLPKNSVLFSSRAPIGYIAIAANEVCTNQGFKSIIPKNVDSLFLYYLLKYNKNYIESLGSGTTFKEISGAALGKVKVSIPESIEEQRKIAELLDCIDSKIENNYQINDNLASMAMDIYMHTFFGKEPNAQIADILVENVKSKVKVGEAKALNAGNIPFFTSGEAILEWHDPMLDGRVCYLNTGGNPGVKFYVGKAAYSTDTWAIHAKNELTDYLYLFLQSIKEEIGLKHFKGTSLKHLQKDSLKSRKLYIPTEIEIIDFNRKIKPMFDTISENYREIQQLTKLRDWLLPMLMNGQATIE